MDDNHLEHGLASRQPVPHHRLQQGLALLLQLIQLHNQEKLKEWEQLCDIVTVTMQYHNKVNLS